MNTPTKHSPKLSIEAKLRAIEDACELAKVDNSQIEPNMMLVHVGEIRDILITLGVLGGPSDDLLAVDRDELLNDN